MLNYNFIHCCKIFQFLAFVNADLKIFKNIFVSLNFWNFGLIIRKHWRKIKNSISQLPAKKLKHHPLLLTMVSQFLWLSKKFFFPNKMSNLGLDHWQTQSVICANIYLGQFDKPFSFLENKLERLPLPTTFNRVWYFPIR